MGEACAAPMMLPADIIRSVQSSRTLLRDAHALADCGGRFAGSESEKLAYRLLDRRLREVPDAIVREQVFDYQGWRRKHATLKIVSTGRSALCHSLVLSPDTPKTGLEAEVVQLGRGAPEDFDRQKIHLRGRIGLVEHEYPFGDHSIHRRVKYNRCRDEGCVGFIIANNLADGGLVTGSSGEGLAQDIPALGVEQKTGRELSPTEGKYPRVRVEIATETFVTKGANLVADLREGMNETVILCAHYDGHDLAESAMDNASGVAAAIQVFELLAPYASAFLRNLRLVLFTNEEWKLFGSRNYVSGFTAEQLSRIAMVINLDTLAGSSRLSVITSGFEEISSMAGGIGLEMNHDIHVVPRLIPNSDHFNFAIEGVPALRLIAGFNEPDARTRYLLTSRDTRDQMRADEMRNATGIAAAFVWYALMQERAPLHKRRDEMRGM